jgi:hypothetical protein
LIEGGEVQALGDPAEVIKQYLNLTIPAEAGRDGSSAPGRSARRLLAAKISGFAAFASSGQMARPDHLRSS